METSPPSKPRWKRTRSCDTRTSVSNAHSIEVVSHRVANHTFYLHYNSQSRVEFQYHDVTQNLNTTRRTTVEHYLSGAKIGKRNPAKIKGLEGALDNNLARCLFWLWLVWWILYMIMFRMFLFAVGLRHGNGKMSRWYGCGWGMTVWWTRCGL